jgi:hypothetical protein
MTIVSALGEALEALANRRPTPMEIKNMAANIAETIETEIEKRVAKASASFSPGAAK